MNFQELLICAKAGDNDAVERILLMYQPLLVKEAIFEGAFDEDLYQELSLQLFLCIQKFRIRSALKGRDVSLRHPFSYLCIYGTSEKGAPIVEIFRANRGKLC